MFIKNISNRSFVMNYYGDIRRKLEEESVNLKGEIDKQWVIDRLTALGWTPEYQKVEDKIRYDAEGKFESFEEVELYVVEKIKSMPSLKRGKGRPRKVSPDILDETDDVKKLRKMADDYKKSVEEEKKLEKELDEAREEAEK